jgi:hypothetical protein
LFVDIAHKAIERADLGASDIDTVVNQLRQRRGFNRAAVESLRDNGEMSCTGRSGAPRS